MKVLKGAVELKLAAIFVFFAAALLLSANLSSHLVFSSADLGVSVAQADEETVVIINNADAPIVNEMPGETL